MEKRDFKILIADDDAIVRDVITTILLQEGYSVISAVDGLDAINRLRTEEIRMVITDLQMPKANGIEVLKFAMRSKPDIAVVILTAYGTLDTTLEAVKEGAYDYLTKPFKTQEIVILAKRAHQLALLIDDNRELRKNLHDTYHDLELLKTVAASNKPDVMTGWLERIEKLKAMDVLLTHETEVLKERMRKEYAKG